MASTTKKKTPETATVTRAEKNDGTKNLIREILAVKPLKHNELIDEVSKLYVERYGDQSDNINDVKGRVGSVLGTMKKESLVMYDGGMYALKARVMPETEEKVEEVKVQAPAPVAAEEKPAPKKRGRKPKAKAEPETVTPVEETKVEEVKVEAPAPVAAEEKPAPKKRGRKPKEKAEPAPVGPVEEVSAKQPAPVAEPVPEKAEEVPMVEVKEEIPAPTPVEEDREVVPVQEVKAPTQLEIKERVENKPVMDMSFLFGNTPVKAAEKKAPEVKAPVEKKAPEVKAPVEKKAPEVKAPVEQPKKQEVKKEEKIAPKAEQKPAPKAEQKPVEKPQANVRKMPQGTTVRRGTKTEAKPLTAEEKLRESFLKKIRSLGGDYFEYYSVYLLERYSMKNGRRLESLRVSGGDNDGGIDGEIELTDKLGFKETIYIQSKNWNPEKGDERLWVVGETLLQQFIGACACRQAKDGKQNCRGIFITTSRFTPEAKRILDEMSDKIVGYDGNDVFEAAKECGFGVVMKNGQWQVDENLLSGIKAFFSL